MSVYNELENKIFESEGLRDSELFDKMKYLYPNLTIEEYEDELEREGFENLNHRINLNLKSRFQMIDKYGGDGKGLLRKHYDSDQKGLMDRTRKRRLKNKKKWNQLLKTVGR